MQLKNHEDREVVQSKIAITKSGDSLNDVLAVDPLEFGIGETVYIVLECEVAKVTYEEIKGTDALLRLHTLRADLGTIIERGVVAKTFAAKRAAIAAMLERDEE